LYEISYNNYKATVYPSLQDTITHSVNLSLTLLKVGKICPKYVELILEINKSLLLHLVCFSILFTYIDEARSNTNQYSVFKHL